MTDNLFHELPEAQVVLRTKGVYRQAKLYRRGNDIYAAYGSGFVRLLAGSGTTSPHTIWQPGLNDNPEVDLGDGRTTPRWTA